MEEERDEGEQEQEQEQEEEQEEEEQIILSCHQPPPVLLHGALDLLLHRPASTRVHWTPALRLSVPLDRVILPARLFTIIQI